MFVWHWMELESDIVEALAAASWWLHLLSGLQLKMSHDVSSKAVPSQRDSNQSPRLTVLGLVFLSFFS